MYFQKTFFRYVTTASGPATVALGADSAPTTNYGTQGTPPAAVPTPSAANVDNIIHMMGTTKSGEPVERLAVVMIAPSGAPAQSANLYAWDNNSKHWILVNASAVLLSPNQVAFFDVAVANDPIPTSNVTGGVGAGTGGNSVFMLVVASTGGPPSGVYQFILSPAVNVPSSTAGTTVASTVIANQGTAGASPWPVDTTGGDLAASDYELLVGGANGIIKGSAGTFIEMDGVNEGSAAVWIYLFNQTTVPAGPGVIGTQFLPAIPVPSKQPFSLRIPKAFGTGLVWAASSTGNGSFTQGAGASTGTVTIHVEYK